MQRWLSFLLASATSLAILIASMAVGVPGAGAEGGTFPAQPFNKMQVTYSVTGATLGSPNDVSGFTTSRSYNSGKLAPAGNLELSGAATGFCDAVNYVDIIAESWAGDQKKTNTYKITCGGYGGSKTINYSASVPIPAGATTGGFGITLNYHTGMGNRSLIVSGSLSRTAAVAATAVPTPTSPPAQAKLVLRATAPAQILGFGPETGDDIKYYVRVTNEGTAPAGNVILNWSASASSSDSLTYGPGDQPSGWGCAGSGPQAVGCGPVMLGPGESVSVEISMVPPLHAGTITANATVQGDCGAGACSDSWNGTTSVVQNRPQIQASIDAPSSVNTGEEVPMVFGVANRSSVPVTAYAQIHVPGFETGFARIANQSPGLYCQTTAVDFGDQIPFLGDFPAGGSAPIIGCGPFQLKAGETVSATFVAVSPGSASQAKVQVGIVVSGQDENGTKCNDEAFATIVYGAN
jgi:hypothetical protein